MSEHSWALSATAQLQNCVVVVDISLGTLLVLRLCEIRVPLSLLLVLRALSVRPKFTVRRHKSNRDSLRVALCCSWLPWVCRSVALVYAISFFFFFTLVTGPRRSLSLKFRDTRVHEPQIPVRSVRRCRCYKSCEPSLDASSFRSDVTSPIKILSSWHCAAPGYPGSVGLLPSSMRDPSSSSLLLVQVLEGP